MKATTHISMQSALIIRKLRITTWLRLHPEFVTKPRAFARRHNVDLANDIFPVTDIRNDPDADYRHERIKKIKANIHLVSHSIRLFTMRDSKGDWIQSIDLYPSQLLYNVKRHPHAKGDLQRSLSILMKQVAPLLADPLDALHIVPGLVQDMEHVASWSEVDSELLMPAIYVQCFHNLNHQLTGPAQGTKPKRIQLGNKNDDCVIRIKEEKSKIKGVKGAPVEGCRVRLILQGRALTNQFAQFGTTATIDNDDYMVAFTESSIAQVHQSVTGRMEGTYLAVPAEWRNRAEGKPMTSAKFIALLSRLTSIPLDELQAMDEDIRDPSKRTIGRLDKDLEIEFNRLAPVSASSLFQSITYPAPIHGIATSPGEIDAEIARVYGMASSDSILQQV